MKKKKITKLEDLQTVKDAYQYHGIDRSKAVPASTLKFFPARHRKAIIAMADLVIVIETANMIENGGKKWTPDYSNSSIKYEPWFYFEKASGKGGSSGFRLNVVDGWASTSGVGSRLAFLSDRVGRYVSTTKAFLDLYNTFFL